MAVGKITNEDELEAFIRDRFGNDQDTRIRQLQGAAASFSVGDLKFSAAFVPTSPGWLLCDGSAVSRTGDTKALFDALGTAYGVGDGSTTFNLPDYRGRGAVGEDSGAVRLGTFNTRGQSGGEDKHTLTEPEIPGHAHAQNRSASGGGPGTEGVFSLGGGNGSTPDGGQLTSIVGGSGAHNNMPPYQVGNWLVKT